MQYSNELFLTKILKYSGVFAIFVSEIIGAFQNYRKYMSEMFGTTFLCGKLYLKLDKKIYSTQLVKGGQRKSGVCHFENIQFRHIPLIFTKF